MRFKSHFPDGSVYLNLKLLTAYLRLLLEHFRGIVDYEKFYSLPEDLFQHLCPDSLFLGSLVCQCVCVCVVALTVDSNSAL